MTARGTKQLGDRSVLVWRVIAAAGVNGIGSTPLYDTFRAGRDQFARAFSDVDMCMVLQCLLRGGYAERTGENRYGVWKFTEACKVPKGETIPEWLYTGALADSKAADLLEEEIEREARRAAVRVVMPKRPVSVFNQGDEPYAFTRTRLGRPAAATRAEAP